MSSTQAHASPEAVGSEQTIMEWQVHLAARQPARAAMVLGTFSLTLVVGFLLTRSPLMTLVIVFAMFSSVSEFLFPIRYRLTTRGAYMRNSLSSSFIEWDRVKKVYLGADGVKLSPLARKSRLEAFRGLALRFGEDNREQVIEEVRKWRKTDQTKL